MINLIDKIKTLPKDAGIYQYFDKDFKILYIGKAKNLKKRISSYFCIDENRILPASKLSPRISNMVQKIADIRTIIVNNEQEALILENSLIKQLKPKYNILLRDDKTYPYILIDKNDNFPRLEIVRKIEKDKNHLYFGPYSSGIKDIVDSIYEFVPLVQKKSCIKGKKACLFHQINRCLAPCENKISKEEYAKILENAAMLLNNPSKLMALLTQKMQKFASKLQFEEANLIKLRIQKIKQITDFSVIDLAKLYNYDIFVIASKAQKSVLVKMFMRNGKITFSDYYFFNHNDNEVHLDYLYTQALINHYKLNPPFKLDAILLPIDITSKGEISEFLYSHFALKTHIQNPKNGDKKKLVSLATKNAFHLLEDNNEGRILEDLRSMFSLESVPNKIEVFDTSHHAGSHSVGGMIAFEYNHFAKNHYRRYILKGSDEYSQMREMLIRRAKDFDKIPPPDLWLIDGGVGQINIALEVLESSGVAIEVLAIAKEKIDSKAHRAKGGARDIVRSKHLELRLDKFDTRLLFLQRLRDEAHRFAITFHRTKKRASLQDGKYSPAQLKKLLGYFGSFDNLNKASEDEIKELLQKRKK